MCESRARSPTPPTDCTTPTHPSAPAAPPRAATRALGFWPGREYRKQDPCGPSGADANSSRRPSMGVSRGWPAPAGAATGGIFGDPPRRDPDAAQLRRRRRSGRAGHAAAVASHAWQHHHPHERRGVWPRARRGVQTAAAVAAKAGRGGVVGEGAFYLYMLRYSSVQIMAWQPSSSLRRGGPAAVAEAVRTKCGWGELSVRRWAVVAHSGGGGGRTRPCCCASTRKQPLQRRA